MLNFQNERIPQNKTVNIAQDLESIRKIRWVVCVNLKIMRGLWPNLKVNLFNIYKYSCFIHYIYYIIHFTNA